MKKRRVTVYVDGFNLYHALCNLKEPSYRWLDLRKLANQFIHSPYAGVVIPEASFSSERSEMLGKLRYLVSNPSFVLDAT